MSPQFHLHFWARLLACAALAAVSGEAQSASSVTLSATPNPSNLGQAVTLTATVTTGATGKVTFYDGSTILGTSTIAGTQATLVTELLPVGSRSLRAFYLGDLNYQTSSSSVLPHTVVAGPSLGLQSARSLFGVAPYSSALAVGDFNNDGKLDLVLASDSSSSLGAVMLGKGDGTFTLGPALPSGAYAVSVAVGDFNGDGKQDLVLGSSAYSVEVLLGNGDGSFGTPTVLQTSATVGGVAVADFNGDGKADIVAGLSGQVGILLGNGDGTFAAVVKYAAANASTGTVADLNLDVIPDVVTGGTYGTNVGILLGKGDGTFQTATSVALSQYTSSIVAGDFNGDGKPDLAVLAYYPGSIAVLIGNGNGTFQNPVTYQTNYYAYAIVAADLDGDGKIDLAVLNSSNGAIYSLLWSLLGNGDGTFQNATTGFGPAAPAGAYAALAADFNGDGKTDIATFLSTFQGGEAVMLGGGRSRISPFRSRTEVDSRRVSLGRATTSTY